MAKRNIARTAIEGGRAKVCRELEHEEDQYNRRVWKKFCCDVVRDDEIDEPPTEILIGGWDRYRAGREFRDKLGPVKNWLKRQVGRPWNKVKSEITAKFDRRTLAGRHVLEHVDQYVTERWDPWSVSGGWIDENGVHVPFKWKHGRIELYVDREGILRAGE